MNIKKNKLGIFVCKEIKTANQSRSPRMNDFSQKCIKLTTFNTSTNTIYIQKQTGMVH